ncbi:MAG: hypothetical protein PWP15_1519 [Methanothermococcus sp.]|jgi:predicted transcriptional regulator|uniref:CBS domain-containing protein n=1 Tax=Methanothermococcus TaxID=155862 RepID=UPI00036E4E58|nr:MULTISPECIES: CBS domain-containing protein [Methanothermococcus]MDK2791010.1 hypothetical protein [Methanothermococcus sp.]MDK2988321.1 hypothetical protein [Methanothermococcus sp.]
MKVKEIMSPKIYKISEEESLYGAFKAMHEKGIKRVFVGDDDEINGVISYRDLVDVFVNRGLFELMDIKVKDVALKEILKINENDDVKDAAQIMVHADVSALLVVNDKNKPVGVVSQTDILRTVVKE